MDFLLIVLAFGGFVVAIVMLVLASRANRLQQESDDRVETLEAMATGSVLFAHAPAAEPVFEPVIASESAWAPEAATLPLFAETAPRPEPATRSARVTILEPAPLPPMTQPSPADDLDLALNEFADEDELSAGDAAVREEPPAPRERFAAAAAAYPFVMTVPATAGVGRVQVSFDRARSRSRP
jgi:hypothetical protein